MLRKWPNPKTKLISRDTYGSLDTRDIFDVEIRRFAVGKSHFAAVSTGYFPDTAKILVATDKPRHPQAGRPFLSGEHESISATARNLDFFSAGGVAAKISQSAADNRVTCAISLYAHIHDNIKQTNHPTPATERELPARSNYISRGLKSR